MNENIKIGVYPFVVEDFHVDCTGKLAFGILGNHFLNCSNLHARERGFGIGSYNGESYTWVISRLVVDFIEPISRNDTFTLQTWVSKVYHNFIDRNYRLVNDEFRLIGRAHAIWAMININDRKPVNLVAFHGQAITDSVYESTDSEFNIRQGKVKLREKEPCFEHEIAYGDLDLNSHVNSIRYVEHALNQFPLEVYENRSLSRLEVAYVEESSYGDRLLFYKQELDDTSYYIEIRKSAGGTVCRCKFFFR